LRTRNEQRLTALVADQFVPSCDRAATDSLPPMVGPGDNGNNDTPVVTAPRFLAGISCAPFGSDAPDELSYWLMSAAGHSFVDVVSAPEWIANRAGWLEIPRGDCQADRRALEPWAFGPLSGSLICFSTPTLGSVLYWTYDESDVIGRATRADGDLDALLEWWEDDARNRRPSSD
jgi:hypothetical protein